MTPSTNQDNTQGQSYDSEAGRFLESDVNVMPLIKGIQEYERALAWHQEAHKHDADKRVKEAIAARLKALDKKD